MVGVDLTVDGEKAVQCLSFAQHFVRFHPVSRLDVSLCVGLVDELVDALHDLDLGVDHLWLFEGIVGLKISIRIISIVLERQSLISKILIRIAEICLIRSFFC